MIYRSIINESYNERANTVKDILTAILEHRTQRGWSEYELAERSGLPQSTISSWYR